MKPIKFLMIASFLVSAAPGFASEGGHVGGGDTVSCKGHDGAPGRSIAIEMYETERGFTPQGLAKFLGPLSTWNLDTEMLLTAYLDYVEENMDGTLGKQLKSIRKDLHFHEVIRFRKTPPATGDKIGFWERRDGCKVVFTAYQDMEANDVELLIGQPAGGRRGASGSWNVIPAADQGPSDYANYTGYTYASRVNQSVLKLHEIFLHKNWLLNPNLPLVELEAVTQTEVEAFVTQGAFFDFVNDRVKQLGRDQLLATNAYAYRTECNEAFYAQGHSIFDRAVCIVGAWANAQHSISPLEPLTSIWHINGGNLSEKPSRADTELLVNEVNYRYHLTGCHRALVTEFYLNRRLVTTDDISELVANLITNECDKP